MARYHEVNHAPSPMMQPYRTHDDRWLLFNMVRTEPLRDALFDGLGASELLADARFDTLEGMRANGAELSARLQDIIGQKTSAEWLRLFDDLDVPVTRIARVEEALGDPQVLQNGMAVPGADTVGLPFLLRHPIRVSSAPLSNAAAAPGLGEHSDEILRELGYGDAEIEALKAQGVI
jgi:formyl-CoA transferase